MAQKRKTPPTLADLTRRVLDFRTQRDWAQFHNPKELAISLCVESAELLELMQWKAGAELDQTIADRREDLADELGDVLHSVLLLAHELGVDPAEALLAKLEKTAQKYPVDRSRGKARKYNEL